MRALPAVRGHAGVEGGSGTDGAVVHRCVGGRSRGSLERYAALTPSGPRAAGMSQSRILMKKNSIYMELVVPRPEGAPMQPSSRVALVVFVAGDGPGVAASLRAVCPPPLAQGKSLAGASALSVAGSAPCVGAVPSSPVGDASSASGAASGKGSVPARADAFPAATRASCSASMRSHSLAAVETPPLVW